MLLRYFGLSLGIIPFLNLHAEVTLDGTLGSRAELLSPNYQIGAELGQQHGSNLFHSFRDFNINRGESATFSGPNSVQNIISRVTGGNPSHINGLLRSTIPNADMYFLNPYGIMFGEQAQLDVQGSFHASTADYLRLGKDGRFDARQPQNSVLTIAPVEAFGFFSNPIASITMAGGGKINKTDWDGKPTGLNVPEGNKRVLLVILKSRQKKLKLVVALLTALTQGKGQGGSIKLNASESVVISGASREGTYHSGLLAETRDAGQAGLIEIEAKNIVLDNGGSISSSTGGQGKAGSIILHADEWLKLTGEAQEFLLII